MNSMSSPHTITVSRAPQPMLGSITMRVQPELGKATKSVAALTRYYRGKGK